MLELFGIQLSWLKLIGIAVATWSIIGIAKWYKEEKKIKALGGHAPRVRSYWPLGLDILYGAVKGALAHKNLEFWQSIFDKAGVSSSNHGAHRYTCEGTPGGRRIIFTADPENIKAILATQFADYGKGKPFHDEWFDFLGDSIFTTDLDQWHDSRQLIRPQFIKNRVSDLQTFENNVEKLLSKMGGRGEEVEMAALFFRYTLDAATEFLLGKSVNSLDNPAAEFSAAFAEVQRVQSIVERAGPANRLVPRGSFYKGLKVINEFVSPYIEQALRLSPEELEKNAKSDSGYTFLHALASFTRDRKVLRDQLVAVLLAGRDTTAATLSWLFYELSAQPKIVQKLRAEILDYVGPDRPPTYDDLKSMKYLQHTMNEILRLYPAVPFNVRLALKDTTLPHGGGPDGSQPIGILKDTPIGYSPLLMQRRTDLYPPTSPTFPPITLFAPERWDNWTPKSWYYIPFNGGPRICIGQQFALTEMGYTVVRILQRFERIERFWRDGEQVMKAEIVLQPGNGVRVGFWEGK
ncbi:MAG: hypothetical protein M1812_002789 [Candelaria pacifica]|nr:MAG: hypothetical protein M1812_002789 [Candelaria pacifica]